MSKKRYFGIIAIATAMMVATVLSSCSHDDFYYSEEKAELSINEKYAIAFEKAFGPVGSNVDWGFSSKHSNARTLTRTGGVAFPSTITFPSDCNASNLKDALPTDENVTKLSDNGAGAGNYYIDETTQSVSTWAGASKIYVMGVVDLSDGDGDASASSWKFAPSNTSEIYLLKDAKLILGEASAKNFNVAAIYIAEDATLESAYSLWANSNTKIYNHGTINVKDLQVNTTSVLYNSGTVSTGTLSAESNSTDDGQSFIVNNGEIECKDVVVNGGAVLNIYNWTVKEGTTKINSPNSGWINNGQWKTYDYAYVGGSKNVINNCYLKVDHDFDINLSSLSAVNDANIGFKINSDGSVETENFYGGRNLANKKVEGGPFRIYMAEYSLFKVNNKATLESGRGPISEDEVGFGFFGPSTGGYAVFQAKEIVRDPTLESQKDHGAVTYGGNLYVSAEKHFAQGYDGEGDGSADAKPFIYEQGGFTLKNIYAPGEDFSPGKPNITIEKTTCSPGFIGGNPLYRVIAEDLSAEEAGDFDFNDVVFDVVKAEGGKTTLRLICAGGTLPLRVRGASEAEGVEVHSVFGETTPNAKGLYQMYNTGAGPDVPAKEFTVDGEYTTPEKINNIIIEVFKDGAWMKLTATRGKAACKILVDDTFKPVTERRNIADENKNFTNYVQGEFQDDFWWK